MLSKLYIDDRTKRESNKYPGIAINIITLTDLFRLFVNVRKNNKYIVPTIKPADKYGKYFSPITHAIHVIW